MDDSRVPKDIIHCHGAFAHYIAPPGEIPAPQDQLRQSSSLHKLAGFNDSHLIELSTDMYDELQRRISADQGPLRPRSDIHWKRNDARRHVGSLPDTKFYEICRDLVTEQERRYPELKTGPTYPLADSMPMTDFRKRVAGRSSGTSSSSNSRPGTNLRVDTSFEEPSLLIQSVAESTITPTKVKIFESDSENDSEDSEDSDAAYPTSLVTGEKSEDSTLKSVNTEDDTGEISRAENANSTVKSRNADSEDAKPEATKLDNAKSDNANSNLENTQHGNSKLDYTKPENAQVVNAKSSNANLDGPNLENTGPENRDGPNFENARPENTRPENPNLESARSETTRPEYAKPEYEKSGREPNTGNTGAVNPDDVVHGEVVRDSERSTSVNSENMIFQDASSEIVSNLSQASLVSLPGSKLLSKNGPYNSNETSEGEDTMQEIRRNIPQQDSLASSVSESPEIPPRAYGNPNTRYEQHDRDIKPEIHEGKPVGNEPSRNAPEIPIKDSHEIPKSTTSSNIQPKPETVGREPSSDHTQAGNEHAGLSEEGKSENAAQSTRPHALDPPLDTRDGENALNKLREERRRLVEQLRSEAARYLAEMRELTKQHEEQIARTQKADADAERWRRRHAKVVAELEREQQVNIERAMSRSFEQPTIPFDLVSPEGKINQDQLHQFSSAISILVATVHATSTPSQDLLQLLHYVVLAVRKLSDEKESKIKQAANQLITVVRNYTISSGLFPRILVDAACSDIAMAVIERVKKVKIASPTHGLSRETQDTAVSTRTRDDKTASNVPSESEKSKDNAVAALSSEPQSKETHARNATPVGVERTAGPTSAGEVPFEANKSGSYETRREERPRELRGQTDLPAETGENESTPTMRDAPYKEENPLAENERRTEYGQERSVPHTTDSPYVSHEESSHIENDPRAELGYMESTPRMRGTPYVPHGDVPPVLRDPRAEIGNMDTTPHMRSSPYEFHEENPKRSKDENDYPVKPAHNEGATPITPREATRSESFGQSDSRVGAGNIETIPQMKSSTYRAHDMHDSPAGTNPQDSAPPMRGPPYTSPEENRVESSSREIRENKVQDAPRALPVESAHNVETAPREQNISANDAVPVPRVESGKHNNSNVPRAEMAPRVESALNVDSRSQVPQVPPMQNIHVGNSQEQKPHSETNIPHREDFSRVENAPQTDRISDSPWAASKSDHRVETDKQDEPRANIPYAEPRYIETDRAGNSLPRGNVARMGSASSTPRIGGVTREESVSRATHHIESSPRALYQKRVPSGASNVSREESMSSVHPTGNASRSSEESTTMGSTGSRHDESVSHLERTNPALMAESAPRSTNTTRQYDASESVPRVDHHANHTPLEGSAPRSANTTRQYDVSESAPQVDYHANHTPLEGSAPRSTNTTRQYDASESVPRVDYHANRTPSEGSAPRSANTTRQYDVSESAPQVDYHANHTPLEGSAPRSTNTIRQYDTSESTPQVDYRAKRMPSEGNVSDSTRPEGGPKASEDTPRVQHESYGENAPRDATRKVSAPYHVEGSRNEENAARAENTSRAPSGGTVPPVGHDVNRMGSTSSAPHGEVHAERRSPYERGESHLQSASAENLSGPTASASHTVPRSTDRYKYQPQSVGDPNVASLQKYLEEKTSGTVEAISELLSGIKSNAAAAELKRVMATIQVLVGGIILHFKNTMTKTQHHMLKEKGSFLVENLEHCMARMDMLRDEELNAIHEEAKPNRHLKQRLAGVSFDMAKFTKELVKTVEFVAIDIEVGDIDRMLA